MSLLHVKPQTLINAVKEKSVDSCSVPANTKTMVAKPMSLGPEAARPLWKGSCGPGLKDAWGLLHPCQLCSGDTGNLARAAREPSLCGARGSALF